MKSELYAFVVKGIYFASTPWVAISTFNFNKKTLRFRNESFTMKRPKLFLGAMYGELPTWVTKELYNVMI